MSSPTSARTAPRSGVSCSLSGNSTRKRSGGGGAATSTAGALQQAETQATHVWKIGDEIRDRYLSQIEADQAE